MAANNKKRSTSLTQVVVSNLTESIDREVLASGDKLPTESALMEEYGVSRTVIREAISRLQAAGLVETRHGIGTFVLNRPHASGLILDAKELTTLEEVIEMLELRMSLEVEAAALAAERRSQEQLLELKQVLDTLTTRELDKAASAEYDFAFHSLIARCAGNRYFIDILNHLGKAIIPRNRLKDVAATTSAHPAYLNRVNMEHEDIYFAIERQDTPAARAAMRLHLTNSKERHRALYEAAQRSSQP
jgi:GntR family transcriptional repressor for pyruvate dehydrogenase complex